jgi:hypothetical protein
MKINKFTSALVALGLVSMASVAHATNPVVYLTGSTAARSIIFAACTASNQVFTGFGIVISTGSSNTGSSANTIVYEGNIAGVGTVDLDCSFTGSEAGIAAVAGQGLSQNVNGGTYNLPGVPPSFLNPANWTTSNAAPVPLSSISGAPANPDLTMADTSQTVSQTSKITYPLVDYGIVGIVPFTFMKGYEATPDTTWNDVNNVTTAEINQITAGPLTANFVTGVAADSGDSVVICGRNLGSGTRANYLLNIQYGINTSVDQWAWGNGATSSLYNGSGVLQFSGSYAAGQTPTEVFNDGYDSGGTVQKNMNVDGTGSGVVMIGYLGISDATHAHNDDNTGSGGVGAASGSGAATFLPFNGNYESDSGVINGSYAYWGQEHLMGSVGQASTGTPGITATNIVHGIALQLISSGAGTKTGAVGPTYSAQSILIPKGSMQATRGTDGGFPTQGTFH